MSLLVEQFGNRCRTWKPAWRRLSRSLAQRVFNVLVSLLLVLAVVASAVIIPSITGQASLTLASAAQPQPAAAQHAGSNPAGLTLTAAMTHTLYLPLINIGLPQARNDEISADPAFTATFGPKRYTRLAGPPQTITETFQRCGTAPAQIVVVNGNADGTNRVSSASILLNGAQVVGPSDFNPHVAKIVKSVVLTDNNQLTIRLASKPGSFLTIMLEYATSPVILSASAPGVSVPNTTTLLSAVSIINHGTAAAENVQVKSIGLSSGVLTSPLPVNLGMIPIDGVAVLNADFSGGPFLPGSSHALTAGGTYAVGAATYCFALAANLIVPPAAPGSALLHTVLIGGQHISGAPFPPQPPGFDEDKTNPAGWTVPTGPFVPGTPTPNSTAAQMAPARLQTRAPAAGTVVFTGNHPVGITNGSTIAEPSGASGGGVVFVTSNWFAAYSTDDGATFTQLDPTTVFPNDAVGFCCDQIVQYVPSIDRFIWLLQGIAGYRLASASPADIINSGGTSWTYWNLTPGIFGSCGSFDYPDLSVGNNSLYMSWDAGGGGCGGFQVARTSLAGIQAVGTISIDFTDPANGGMAWGSHLSQDTGDEIFWAGHNSNSQMRIFSLQEGSNTYFWRDRGVSSWANNTPTSTTPDGQDWLCKNFNACTGNGAFPRNGVIGATRSGNQVWFAWSAGTDKFFQQPHVEMVSVDRSSNFNVTQQVQIWNNSYAFAYPALATNACTSEVGLSLEYGGNGNYENHVVGLWGDFLVYITPASNVGTNRFGDYVTIRQKPPTEANPGNLFDAFGYGLNSVPPPGAGVRVDIHYVTFGRPAASCLIEPGLK
jgi:hypothetical protein